jgi:hypothetical protein
MVFAFISNLYFDLFDRPFSKQRFVSSSEDPLRYSSHCPVAGNDPEQNGYDSENEEDVNQSASGAGNQPQHPHDDQHDRDGV